MPNNDSSLSSVLHQRWGTKQCPGQVQSLSTKTGTCPHIWVMSRARYLSGDHLFYMSCTGRSSTRPENVQWTMSAVKF